MGCDVSGQVYIPATVKFTSAITFFVILNILSSFCGTLANGLVITVVTLVCELSKTRYSSCLPSQTSTWPPWCNRHMWRPCFTKSWVNNIVFCGTFASLYLSLTTMVILSVQSYLPLAYPYHCQNIVTMRRLKITVICSWVYIVAATFPVKFNSPLQIYLTVLIISSTISIVVFTWIRTCRLVARHRKAIEATQTPSAREIVSKKKILRSTVTALAAILSLLCCYLFGLCFIFFKFLLNAWKIDGDTNSILAAAVATLMYLNSLLNPCLVFCKIAVLGKKLRICSIREKWRKLS